MERLEVELDAGKTVVRSILSGGGKGEPAYVGSVSHPISGCKYLFEWLKARLPTFELLRKMMVNDFLYDLAKKKNETAQLIKKVLEAEL